MAGDIESWHLDKRVPIAFIVSFAIQTALGIWWAATFSATTNQRLVALEERQAMAAPQGDRLTRVEVKLETAIDGILEIKGLLRQERSGNGLTGPR